MLPEEGEWDEAFRLQEYKITTMLIINEENKALKKTRIVIPSKLVDLIKQRLAYCKNKSANGYKRACHIVQNNGVSNMEAVKRMKNNFDNGLLDSFEFWLLGGAYMKNWIDGKLEELRNSIQSNKEMKKKIGIPTKKIRKLY